MSVEHSAPAKIQGVVRSSLVVASHVLQGLYVRAEQYPIIKYSVDTVKPYVPVVAPYAHKVVSAADPWVDSFDLVVTQTWKTVNSNVVEPARQRNAHGHVSFGGVAAVVSQAAALQLKNRYSVLLDFTDHAVDVWLPDTTLNTTPSAPVDEKDTFTEKSLSSVGSKAQKRAYKLLGNKFQDVRAFSGGRLKEIIHVDLIEYAENGYKSSLLWTEQNVYPVASSLYNSSSQLVVSTQVNFSSVSTASKEKLQLLWDAIARYRALSYEKYVAAYDYAHSTADAYGVPKIVAKAKEVSVGEVSDYVLVKLQLKNANEEFVVVERKLIELLKTLLGLILVKDFKTTATPAPTPKTNEAQ